MPWSASLAVLAVLVAVNLPMVSAASEPAEPWIEQSRELGRQLMAALKQRLQAAMSEQGPAAAIDVCRVEAPAIAADLSEISGASVRRTALRVRNPSNAPDDFEREVLRNFAASMERGELASTLERAEQRSIDGRTERRYMKAIATEPVCLTCHGSRIPADVAAAIARVYPDDEATGFAVGDLRGALTVIWADTTDP